MSTQTTAQGADSSCQCSSKTTPPAGNGPCSCSGQTGFLGSCMPIALMILVFYFLIMRPQQKREAKRRELVNSVKKGDHVLISSGIIGTLHKIINDKEVSLEISDGVYVRILKNSIVEVFEKGPEAGKIETDESETVRKSKVRKPMSEKSTKK